MSHEVDVIAVGDNGKSGDAFALRFGNFVADPTDQKIVVIDGGFKESGEKLVERIRRVYGTNHVDLVISTHPDTDHVSGLHVVLEEMEVDTLWMHRPWTRSEEIRKMAEERDLVAEMLAEIKPGKIKKSMECAYDLEKLALQKRINIEEPFSGKSAFDSALVVLGPSEDFYHALVAEFEKGGTYSISEKAKRLWTELWDRDSLVEPETGSVSPRNNSSVVLLIRLGEEVYFFCGDAGVEALHHAADNAAKFGRNIKDEITVFQVPHHGSKRNLGPSVLNRIVGPILPENQQINKRAFISAAVDGAPKHPSNRVINALIRRGVRVSKPTCGSDQCFRSLDVPVRLNWGPLENLVFQSNYEDEED